MEPTLETAPGGAPLSNPQPSHAKANVGMSELGPTLVLTSEDGTVEPTVEAPDGIWEATLDSVLESLGPTLETGLPKRF